LKFTLSLPCWDRVKSARRHWRRSFAPGSMAFVFDLESPTDLRRLSLPETVPLESAALIIIDEIQRLPGLFEILHVIDVLPGLPGRIILVSNEVGWGIVLMAPSRACSPTSRGGSTNAWPPCASASRWSPAVYPWRSSRRETLK
jgi:hypothetical protein